MGYSGGVTNRSTASLLSRIIVAGGGGGASARYTKTETSKTETVEVYIGSIGLNGSGNYLSALGATNYETTSPQLEGGKTYKFVNTQIPKYDSCVLYTNDGNKYRFISFASTITLDENETFLKWACRTIGDTRGESLAWDIGVYEVREEIVSTIEESSSVSNGGSCGGGINGLPSNYGGRQGDSADNGVFGSGESQTRTNYRYCGGGGGGGWYGGGCAMTDNSVDGINYTGGGSGFVNTASNASYRPSGYTGLQLDSGSTTSGNSSHPSVSGGTEVGHSGNGYARITVL
jgi:hypothetical protein